MFWKKPEPLPVPADATKIHNYHFNRCIELGETNLMESIQTMWGLTKTEAEAAYTLWLRSFNPKGDTPKNGKR